MREEQSEEMEILAHKENYSHSLPKQALGIHFADAQAETSQTLGTITKF